ncbi:MAG TPA: ABC transporter permease [Bacteroidales bacterium]|nr:ABC transporter permease [Bacteroidales bacterium]
MKIILSIIRKEFIQIFRNRVMLPFIFIVPIIQMIVLVFAANLEMKEIKFVVVDNDLSSTSRRLTSEFTGSRFFNFRGSSFDMQSAEAMLAKDDADLIIHFNHGFEKDLRMKNSAPVQLLVNAVNSTKASLVNAYAGNIIMDFNRKIRMEWLGAEGNSRVKSLDISTAFWYNPELNYKIYMLPGILVILVTIIGMFLTALNLVREKELGTSEQINVTPIRKFHFIFGKLFPFWVIALFELAFGLTVGKFFFHLPILGSLGLLFLFASVYLLVVLGIGLLISALSSSQQQVMFLSFFFMLTFILMSGIFTPVESMPQWAQTVNIINPFAYFMKVIRMILLKGSGFRDIACDFYSILVYAGLILSLAVWRYRKVS